MREKLRDGAGRKSKELREGLKRWGAKTLASDSGVWDGPRAWLRTPFLIIVELTGGALRVEHVSSADDQCLLSADPGERGGGHGEFAKKERASQSDR